MTRRSRAVAPWRGTRSPSPSSVVPCSLSVPAAPTLRDGIAGEEDAMLALRLERFGPPDVSEAVDVPMPVAGPGSALAHVPPPRSTHRTSRTPRARWRAPSCRACPAATSRAPWRRGLRDGSAPGPGAPAATCGSPATGSHAEAAPLPAGALVREPRNLSFEQAASIGVASVAAWLGAVEYGELQSGEEVAVIGVGGGVLSETALRLAAPRGRAIGISATGKRCVEFDLVHFYHGETRLIGADSRKPDAVASARLMAELVPGFKAGFYKPPLIAERHPRRATPPTAPSRAAPLGACSSPCENRKNTTAYGDDV